MRSYRFDRSKISARAAALKRFNDWEKKNPHVTGERESIASVSAVYNLVPPEFRRPVFDPSGIQKMHFALSHLKSYS